MTNPQPTSQSFKQHCRALVGEKRWRASRRQLFQLRYNLSRFPQITIDTMVTTDPCHVFASGHKLDPYNQIVAVDLWLENGTFVNTEKYFRSYTSGKRKIASELLPNCDQPAFAFHVSIVDTNTTCDKSTSKVNTTVQPCGLRVHLRNGQHRLIRYKRRPAPGHTLATVRNILQRAPVAMPGRRALFNDVFGPAIRSAWSNRSQPDKTGELVRCNEHLRSLNPVVSLIIPIYGRYDFIEHQLAQFINDVDMQRHEILYVIDDPRLNTAIMDSIKMLEKVYKIAFSVLFLESNLGYAGANNSGVQHASADTLLLLNSDVLPVQPGWLQALLALSADHINNSIVGARLIYEDNTIQHNGMQFHASMFADDLWINLHPAKGFPVGLVPASQSLVDCESVTGACLLIKRDHYLAINGLDENYILGDYEDSDLCLKARQHGLRIKMAETVVLYHLERQSQSLVSDQQWKTDLTYYNCWQHSNKWDSTIRQLKSSTVK